MVFEVVMSYKVVVNPDLVGTNHCSLGEHGVGFCKLLVTFLSTDPYFVLGGHLFTDTSCTIITANSTGPQA